MSSIRDDPVSSNFALLKRTVSINRKIIWSLREVSLDVKARCDDDQNGPGVVSVDRLVPPPLARRCDDPFVFCNCCMLGKLLILLISLIIQKAAAQTPRFCGQVSHWLSCAPVNDKDPTDSALLGSQLGVAPRGLQESLWGEQKVPEKCISHTKSEDIIFEL